MFRICLTLVAILLLVGSACRKPVASVPANSPGPEANVKVPVPATPAPIPTPESVASEVEPVLGTDPIEYEGYRVTREVKTARAVATHEDTETEFGVLKFGPKTVMRFDADTFGVTGNQIEFAMFPFLSPNRKQLFVERTGYREWEQWIVDLTPRFRVVYHSTDYGFWGGMQVTDIDHDGVYELLTRVTKYYMFADLPHGGSPDVTAILKYDRGLKRYLPGNYQFPTAAIEGIQENIASLHAKSGIDYREQVLTILLTYLYAGKESEGWEFFEKEYTKPDKTELRRKIRQKLAREPVFQYLHSHRTS